MWQRLNRLLFPESTPVWLKFLIDLIVLTWIGWFAWQHGGFLLRDDLYLYGDHPGQFYRLWQLLTIVWPEEGRLVGWSPYWYAGWPELQFYPPGFALLGWLIWMISFQQLSPVFVYQILVFATFVVPAIGFYLLLAWGFNDRLAGLVAAWLTMVAPYPLGGVLGVKIGLLGDRLAFGVTPLLILSGIWGMQTRSKILPGLITGLILAGLMLLHPYQAILPVGILGLYALFCGQGWQTRLRWLAWVSLLSLGLIAFWWLPLGLRRDFFVPIIEAPLLETQVILKNMWVKGMGWLLVAALVGNLLRPGTRRYLYLAIFLGGIVTLGFIFFDYQFLVERLNLFVFIPNRFVTSVAFCLFVGLALGISELSWLGVRLLRRWSWQLLGLPLLVIVPWFFYSQMAKAYEVEKWLGNWQPAPDRTPVFLGEAERKYGLPSVWEAMAGTPGRVLFTSHYGLLFDVPTTLKAVVPILSGREIVGGTFTTRTLVANYLWVGEASPPVLYGKVENEDDKTLAGIPWEAMNDDLLFELASRLNVTQIAATATDVQARTFLDASPRFRPIWSNDLFTLYEPVGYEPVWAEAAHAVATVSRYERRAIEVQITGAAPETILYVKVANYPLWLAKAGGHPLPIETDRYGLMKIALPPGSYTVHLRYQPGWPEWLGEMITLVTVVGAVGILALLPFYRRNFGHIEQSIIGRGSA